MLVQSNNSVCVFLTIAINRNIPTKLIVMFNKLFSVVINERSAIISIINIEIPKKVTEEQRKLLEKFKALNKQ